ncbi:RagB/SusD family nutrient uptake outer membrane protein [Catalinimonas niigatensis]|uniref:RagB/SusD family nutrient uptake outer membrane protein n=1 Tax=Catalinimonas niigatensis TaxID=1397264 RepID=UPI0026659C6A|nr:RagB/SusD family nutrient uptake outer membrane protein [Catalinimonas niigatensis]WPP53584.1 RagB/SusD family nutrient uptake outer membrane protein [Catalinimonas niigatensis]
MKSKIYIIGLLLMLATACEMDIPNPNAATEDDAFNSRQGLLALSAGMRQYYSTAALSRIIVTPGVTARELGAYTTFVNYLNLEVGGDAIENNNSWTSGLWIRLYRVINIGEQIMENTNETVIQDAETRAGILAHAMFFKAISLGTLIQNFEEVPINTAEEGNAPFSNRSEVLTEVISLLTEARTLLVNNPPPASFYDQIGSTLDLSNMINAYLSRYYLVAGNYQEAIEAANAVDLNSISYFVYDSENPNPVWELLVNSNDFRPLDNFGLDASQVDPTDGRSDFFLAPLDTTSAELRLPVEDLRGYFNERTVSIPVYLPGEVLLNKAEAQARLDDVEAAIITLNAVRTKTDDPTGVNAGLTPYAGPVNAEAVLEDIYFNRAIELFLTGMRLEDSRRFGRPGPGSTEPSRTRNFYPYPDTERANNPNIPDDPAI